MYPDFLGIGAQKSGTDWLYQNLRIHHQISMTPVKELNYFDDPTPIPNIIRLSKSRYLRAQLKLTILHCLNEKRYEQVGWILRFYFSSNG